MSISARQKATAKTRKLRLRRRKTVIEVNLLPIHEDSLAMYSLYDSRSSRQTVTKKHSLTLKKKKKKKTEYLNYLLPEEIESFLEKSFNFKLLLTMEKSILN